VSPTSSKGAFERSKKLYSEDSTDALLALPQEDWDSSGDELEKIMASGDIDQDKMRHQLLFGTCCCQLRPDLTALSPL